MNTRPSITIKTSDFSFNKTELIFIRRHLSLKYPGVMNKMIDQTRQLMRLLQTFARANSKYIYYASRIHPDDNERYVVSEMLYGLTDIQQRSIVSIDPIQNRDIPHTDIQTSTRFFNDLCAALTQVLESKRRLVVYGSVSYKQVLRGVLTLLNDIREEVIIQDYSFMMDDENGCLTLDLRHKLNNSHHVSLAFDFFELPKNVAIDDQPTEAQELQSE